MKDWKDPQDPHKNICKSYCANTCAGDWKGGKGQEFPAFIGLLAIGLILEQDCFLMMKRRADVFLTEVKRVVDIGVKNDKNGMARPSIGLVANVVYNFNRPILQCSVNFFDSEVEYGPQKVAKPESIHYIVFEPIGEGGDSVRRRLHPAYGPGDIFKESRKRVVKELKEFIQKVNEHGLFVQQFSYQRGLMWMSDKDFRVAEGKELDEANGGNRLMWMPDMAFAMEDAMDSAMGAAMKATFGGT